MIRQELLKGRLTTFKHTSAIHVSCSSATIVAGATENARPDIARPSKLWGLTSRDLTTRHQIKQIATGWTSVGPRKNWTCWTIANELNRVCHDSTAGLVTMQFLRAVSHSVGAHTESLQPRVDNRSYSNSSEDEDENRHGASCASSANFKGVGIGKGSCSNNFGRLLRSVHRGVASRAGFALVPCNVDVYKTTQWWQRKLLEIDNQSMTQSITIL